MSQSAKKLIVLGSAWGMFLTLVVVTPSLSAQRRVISEKKSMPELGEIPSSPLKVEKLKGTVKSVDLEKRTVTIAHSGKETTLSFPTAAGREKIVLSSKAARAWGKQSFQLEDLKSGSQVRLQYYPALGTIMEMVVEELPR